jgi:hypothetical protein
MPWVTLPMSIDVGRFRFCPIDTNAPATVVDSAIADTVAQALKCYVGRDGKSIERCTIVLRRRHSAPWSIPDKMWTDVRRAAEMLALACLAEQRFLEGPLSPHLNATMFHIIGQHVTAGSDQISVFYPRRGGGLNVGGLRFKDIIFQRPRQVEGTECKAIGVRLLKGLEKARRARHPLWQQIASSLELFLLGHAETPELGWDTCVMLSAMAFERLLEANDGAKAIAEAFAKLWEPYFCLRVVDSKRVKPDHKPEFAAEQSTWPVHRKWMKELYEARSSRAHRGTRPDFSRNWEDGQHMIIVAFTYPLAIKLRLSAVGFYELNEREMSACKALDKLLDSHWGQGPWKPPEWSSILSLAENMRALTANYSKRSARQKRRRRASKPQ